MISLAISFMWVCALGVLSSKSSVCQDQANDLLAHPFFANPPLRTINLTYHQQEQRLDTLIQTLNSRAQAEKPPLVSIINNFFKTTLNLTNINDLIEKKGGFYTVKLTSEEGIVDDWFLNTTPQGEIDTRHGLTFNVTYLLKDKPIKPLNFQDIFERFALEKYFLHFRSTGVVARRPFSTIEAYLPTAVLATVWHQIPWFIQKYTQKQFNYTITLVDPKGTISLYEIEKGT